MTTATIQIMPSLLAADFGQLAEGCRAAEQAGGDQLHLDIMDGHFVGNISFGPAVVSMADRTVDLPLNVHLMVSRPDHYLQAFAEAGADTLLIHVEAQSPVVQTLEAIRELGMRPGLTLNPETPVASAQPFLEEGLVDEVLCMTVHPGFGGQAFIRGVLPKIEALRQAWPALDISVDGGVDRHTIGDAARAGANLFVAGTSLYRAGDMTAETEHLRNTAVLAGTTN